MELSFYPFCIVGCKAESDVVFLMDTSSYIGAENFPKVKNFMLDVVEKLKVSDPLSLYVHENEICPNSFQTQMPWEIRCSSCL